MLIKEFVKCNPKNSPISREFINYVDTASVFDGKLLEMQRLTTDYPSRAQRTIEINDILISSVRPALRHNFYVKEHILHGVASTGYVQVRLNNNDIALSRYLYYFLTTDVRMNYLASIAETSQSTFPAFNKEIIENLDFPPVSLAEQQHIVDTMPRYLSLSKIALIFASRSFFLRGGQTILLPLA